MAQEQAQYLATPVGEREKIDKLVACEKSCMCGTYADMIYQIDSEKLQESDQNLQQALQARHNAQRDREYLRCAREATWFCGSELQQYLMAQ